MPTLSPAMFGNLLSVLPVATSPCNPTMRFLADFPLVLPKINLNCRRRGSGEFSPVTALLATVGNLLRVGTTLAVTDDVLLLTCFSTASCINAVRVPRST